MTRDGSQLTMPVNIDSGNIESELSNIGNILEQGFSKPAFAITALNQGLELASKAISAFSSALTSTADKAIEFSKSIAEVSTLVNDGFATTEELTRVTKELSATYGVMPVDTAKALYQTISAGATDSASATELLSVANQLAIGGVADLTVSVDGLTSALSAYGKDFSKANEVSDAFFVAVKKGKTNVGELSGAIGRLAPLTAAANIELDEALSAVAALTTQGINTAESVTALNAAITNIIKPTKAAKTEALRLGIEFDSTALRGKGLKKFLNDITTSAKFNKQSLEKLFGSVRGLKGVLALTKDEASKFNEILLAMENKAGLSAEAFRTMDQELGAQIDKYSVLKEQAGIALGELSTKSKNAKKFVKGINTALGNLIDTFGSSEGLAAAEKFFSGLTTSAQLFAAMMKVASDSMGFITGADVFDDIGAEFTNIVNSLEHAKHGMQKPLEDINQLMIESNANLSDELAQIEFVLQQAEHADINHLIQLKTRHAEISKEVDRNRRLLQVNLNKSTAEIIALEADALDKLLTIEEKKKTVTKIAIEEEELADTERKRRKKERDKKAKEDAKRVQKEILEAEERALRIEQSIGHDRTKAHQKRFKAADEINKQREAAQANHEQQLLEISAQASQIGAAGIATFFEDMTAGIIQGDLSASKALASFGATILNGLGDQMIALGSAAIAAGVLGTVAPMFAAATGGPAGVGAGIGLVAAGGVLKGTAGAITSLSSGSGGGSAVRARSVNRSRTSGSDFNAPDITSTPDTPTPSSVPSIFGSREGSSEGGMVFENHYHLNGMLAVGSPATLGRSIEDMRRASARLRSDRRMRIGGGL